VASPRSIRAEVDADGFRPPNLSAPVDVARHLAALPPGAMVKGMFFNDLLALAAKVRTPHQLAVEAGIEERRYVAFRDYPLADNLRLTVAVAEVVHARLPLGEALERIGRRAPGIFLDSHIGRTVFGVLGRDTELLILHAPRAYRVIFGFGRVETERTGPSEYMLRVRGMPIFTETYQMGVLASVLELCRARADIAVRMSGIADADVRVRLR
jgi:uncharacterized protein (TIGR02265 family)